MPSFGQRFGGRRAEVVELVAAAFCSVSVERRPARRRRRSRGRRSRGSRPGRARCRRRSGWSAWWCRSRTAAGRSLISVTFGCGPSCSSSAISLNSFRCASLAVQIVMRSDDGPVPPAPAARAQPTGRGQPAMARQGAKVLESEHGAVSSVVGSTVVEVLSSRATSGQRSLDAVARQTGLEGGEPGVVGLRRRAAWWPCVQAVRGERAGDLADVPLDRVQPVAAVGDVGGADVLAGRQQVRHPARQQRAERDLERAGAARRCSCRRRWTGAGRCGTCRRRRCRG